MKRTRRITAAMVIGLTATAAIQQPGTAAPPTAGSRSVGDPYYPGSGNGGYDARHYGIDLAYNAKKHTVTGGTSIAAVATQDLTRFNLDFGLTPRRVLVDGHPAHFSRRGSELTVVPSRPVRKGARFTTVVTYSGRPSSAKISTDGGWRDTPDGAVATGEPQIAQQWYPSNDHPSDKAAFDITIHAAAKKQVISNGTLVSHTVNRAGSTWHWREKAPMATYLATIAIGDYAITTGRTKGGVPYLNALSRHLGKHAKGDARALAATGEVTDWLAGQYGPYPFSSTGGIVTPSDVGYALETQTRPVYPPEMLDDPKDGVPVVAHELAHQWFGDSVSVDRWSEIWLNEGFAQYSEKLFKHRSDPAGLTHYFAARYQAPASQVDVWGKAPLNDPGVKRNFGSEVYVRGALTLGALRNVVGDKTFRTIVRTWVKQHRYGNATTAQFEQLASQISGKDLSRFFKVWVHSTAKPPAEAALGVPKSWTKPTKRSPND